MPLYGICILVSLEAQTTQFRILGLAYSGSEGSGAVYSLNTDGTGYTKLKSFSGTSGALPIGNPLKASDNFIYGMTVNGGAVGLGVLYRVNADGTGYTTIHDFDGTGGSSPASGLLEGTDGFLYGVTADGGVNDKGILFKISKSGSGFQKLVEFDGSNKGDNPRGSLLLGLNGEIYGVTSSGGVNSMGAIYHVKQDGTGFVKIKDFDSNSGGSPSGGLVQASNGDLFGMIQFGGSNAQGSIYSIKPDGSVFTNLYEFDSGIAGGIYPDGNLVIGTDGYLYGMTSQLSTAFKMSTAGTNFGVISDLSLYYPSGSLVLTTSGDILGGTTSGGTNDKGFIFKLNTNSITNIYSLSTSSGIIPNGLVEISTGLYLVNAFNGGASNNGVIFKLSSGGIYTKLKEFLAGVQNPRSELVLGPDEAWYGFSENGGTYGFGTIFKINANGTGFNLIYSFNGSEGAHPRGPLVFNSAGQIMGVTYTGGAFDSGVLFQIEPDGQDYSVIRDFGNGTDGALPEGGLLITPDHYIYGTTSFGGAHNMGTIFKLDEIGGGSYLNIFSFNSTTGRLPYGTLMRTTLNEFYGITRNGGTSNKGTIYKVQWNGTGFTTLVDFDGATKGTWPTSSLMLGTDNLMYGTTYFGGVNDNGTAFRVATDGSDFTKFVDFQSSTSGDTPWRCTLKEAPDGYVYGTTFSGGAHALGTVFRIKMDDASFQTIFNFDFPNGTSPLGGVVVIDGSEVIDGIETAGHGGTILYPNPSKEILTVDLGDLSKGHPVKLAVYDMSGRKMENRTVESGIKFDLEIGDYPSGIYLLHITNGNATSVAKFIKH